MHSFTQKLTGGFVQSKLLLIACGKGSASVDLPENTQTFTVTNPSKLTEAWVSFGAAGSDLQAVVGVGHLLIGGMRIIVEKTAEVAKVAAIAVEGKHSTDLVIYVEAGAGGLSEQRKW